MSGSDTELNESSNMPAAGQNPVEPDAYSDSVKREPPVSTEKLSAEIEQFSGLSLEMSALLARISHEIKGAAEQVSQINSAIDLKKKELKDLHGIEASIAEMDRLNLEYQRRKEELERALQDQRALWDDEIAGREKERQEYMQNLRIRREQEEEEYRQAWAGEKLKARQQLAEELKEKQQALERECQERELVLKEKELEWVELIQELEQFMSKLIRRTQASSHPELITKAARVEARTQELSLHDARARSSIFVGEMEKPVESIWGGEAVDESRSAISSLKEMLLSQGRRIEGLHADQPGKGSVPLKFQPKRQQE